MFCISYIRSYICTHCIYIKHCLLTIRAETDLRILSYNIKKFSRTKYEERSWIKTVLFKVMIKQVEYTQI